jgi:hypothetical protein
VKFRTRITRYLHGTFLEKLGGRHIDYRQGHAYTDGGAHDEGRHKRRAKNRAARKARKVNRG